MTRPIAELVVVDAARIPPAWGRRACKSGWRISRLRRSVSLRAKPAGSSPIVFVCGAVTSPAALEAVDAAVAALAHQDLVLGPTEDGGCWLIGLAQRRGTPPGLFASAARARTDMIEAIIARLPIRLWRVELLALEDFPRLRLSPR